MSTAVATYLRPVPMPRSDVLRRDPAAQAFLLLRLSELMRSIASRFVLEDWHNFGLDYDRTLAAWHENFERAWPQLRERYGERFRRLWNYYLAASAADSRAGRRRCSSVCRAPGASTTSGRTGSPSSCPHSCGGGSACSRSGSRAGRRSSAHRST